MQNADSAYLLKGDFESEQQVIASYFNIAFIDQRLNVGSKIVSTWVKKDVPSLKQSKREKNR